MKTQTQTETPSLEEMRAEIARLKAKRQNRPLITQDGVRASYDYDGTPQHRRCEDAPCCGCCQ